jgi:cytochrome c nitrite reductase small subunit
LKRVFSKFHYSFAPPFGWRLPVNILLGILVGFALTAVRISNAVSYLSAKPETCVNCHVMYPQYAAWAHNSHGRPGVASCSDCHVPQDNFFRKYLFKASDGMRHSYVFTLRLEPHVIRAKNWAVEVIQENCQRCHENLIHRSKLVEVSGADKNSELLCWDCHRDVPHGRVRSLAATPYALTPRLGPAIPQWMEEFLFISKQP